MSNVDIASLPALPRDHAGPVFHAPWEAQVFALTVKLNEQGVFSWPEWCQHLGAEIGAAQARGDPDLGDTYYSHWLAALERLLDAKGIVSRLEQAARKQAWADALERTPHGKPIRLDTRPRSDG